jgi:glutamate--cysteine ligase catalytic subunit
LIATHVRYQALENHVKERRGKNVDIRIPIFKDKNTNVETSTYLEPYPGFIYMDSTAFGTGLSCLQCTFEANDLELVRFMHDTFHILSPLFLALTAGTSIIKGQLTDNDARWNILCASVDDRTEE